MGLNEVQLCCMPKYTKIFVLSYTISLFLMLDDGFKLKCSVDLKKGRGKRKN